MEDEATTAGTVLARVVLVPAYVALLGLALVSGGVSTWSGVVWLGLGLVVLGASTRPARGRPSPTRLGLALVALVVVARTFVAREGAGRSDLALDVVTVRPASTKPVSRLVTRWLDEASLALPAARLVAPRAAHARMRAEYAELRRAEGEAPSPLLASWLGLEGPGVFDLVTFTPRGAPARGTVVFLHGSLGAFVLPCRHVARAVAPLGLATACPARGVFPSWSSDEGRVVVERTIARVGAPVILVGLSDGAEGASLLAPALGRERLAGLVLLSGAAAEAGAPPVPTLVLAGTDDQGGEATYAARHASLGRVTASRVDGGHFVMLEAPGAVDDALRAFVAPLLP